MFGKLVHIFLLLSFSACAFCSDFAVSVVGSAGLGRTGLYDNPNAVLGKPSTWIYDDWEEKTYACSLVHAAFETDPNYDNLITTIEDGDYIIVEFDHKIADDAGNPYGIDFLVFGNSAFLGNGYVEPDTDMDTYFLQSPASLIAEPVLISVSQIPDANDDEWFSFFNGPYGDTAFPTNAFAWDSNSGAWGAELDWLRPVDPNLLSDFDGLSAADAIALYDGSAGGTGFDLKWLDPNDYVLLAVDPNSGKRWIKYIKVEFLSGSSYTGEIDAFSDVAGCGDYNHPSPEGDVNGDCRVDMFDVALLSDYWLVQISEPNEPANAADFYDDDIINFKDLVIIFNSRQNCSWDCN